MRIIKSITISLEAEEILSKQKNQSKYIDAAIKEKEERDKTE